MGTPGTIRGCAALAFLSLLLTVTQVSAAPCTGRVVDPSGSSIAAARVELDSGTQRSATTSDANGTFRFSDCPANGTISVSAQGFRSESAAVSDLSQHAIVLRLPGVVQQVTVTTAGTPVPLGAAPESVVVLNQRQLASMAALTVDDKLRQVPGFSLFRRTGSRAANPTAMGVSLRGLGGNGASRTLVLEEGVPLNDPFGGWVFWDRVPQADVSDIQVLRGGGSYIYGSPALSGVIDIVPQPVSADHANIDLSYGNEDTPDISISGGKLFHGWFADFAGEGYRTDGYFLVAPEQRGRVDTRANVRYGTGTVRVGRKFGQNDHVFASLNLFNEGRDNGTALQINGTRLAQLDATLHHESSIGNWDVNASGVAEHYDQTFSSISLDRTQEFLTRAQQVPSQDAGGGVQWSRVFSRQLVIAGADLAVILGHTDELGFHDGAATSHLFAGGRQRIVGVFADDSAQLGRFGISAGARVDTWHNYDGFNDLTPLFHPAAATSESFPDRDETAFSPHLGFSYRVTSGFALTASGYGSFRGPTLNELYRDFRVGNVVTLANPGLKSERLAGAEFGGIYTSGSTRMRANFYWDDVRDPISNVTLSFTPSLITRQRENLGHIRSAGVELDVQSQITHTVFLHAGYLYANAVVTSFPADPALVGLMLPQVPRHTVTFGAQYTPHGWTFALQGRAGSTQYDDDRNLLPLAPYFTLDTFVARRITSNLDAVLGIENLLDQPYEVGRTPVVTFGPPILFRLGARLHFPSR